MVRTVFTFQVTLAIKPLERVREAEAETLRKRVESEQTKGYTTIYKTSDDEGLSLSGGEEGRIRARNYVWKA